MTVSVAELVAAADGGDEGAWAELVRRYTPLVHSVVNQFRLNQADAADVNQTVWLRLVEQLGGLREPAALPGWIATTARRECLRLTRMGRRTRPFDPLDGGGPGVPATVDDGAPDDDLLRAERHQALRDGFAELGSRCRNLLGLLVREPPATYQEVSERLDIPVGSIGPTRVRCLRKLRNSSAMVQFAGALEGGGGDRRDTTPVGR